MVKTIIPTIQNGISFPQNKLPFLYGSYIDLFNRADFLFSYNIECRYKPAYQSKKQHEYTRYI